jgi:hypothetical protein
MVLGLIEALKVALAGEVCPSRLCHDVAEAVN